MDIQGFKNPDTILRPAPFWAINDRITPEETARQMADMISVGLSGGFFHSRHGLVTDYLGDDWFAAMNAALDAAKEKGGYLWLYDEDLWPSGNAGGQVAGMKDEYRSTMVDGVLMAAGEPAPKLSEDQEIKCCYVIKSREGLQVKEYESVPADKIDDVVGYERLFIVRTYMPKQEWWSGESYANLLHPEAMQEFIKMTHEVYLKKLGHEFSKRIPGIFTDEPNLVFNSTGIAWYDGIPALYKEWHGRDFWQDFIFMFFNGHQDRKIRQLIHRTILRQFVEAYSKPIYEWCEKHGLAHTGHYNAEEFYATQIQNHGGSIMAHYRYQHIPGIDHLCRNITNLLLMFRQVSSAARQLGRKQVLTELFGVSRHTNTFEEFKWLGDFDLVHGATFFCPHLAWYSGKGRRKRDYPPVWNYQQTYWKDLNPLNDYFTRISHALTIGKPVVNVLMLHSIDSSTAVRRLGVILGGEEDNRTRRVPVDAPREDMHSVNQLDGQMRGALEAILTAGYDCDLGDEDYIEDMGSVKGDSFVIGEMSYKLVVVPPTATWRPKTFALLKQFVANGGRVILLGELPTELDCEDAKQEWLDFALKPNVTSLPCAAKTVQDAMDKLAPTTFTLKSTEGCAVPLTYTHHRLDGDQEIIFIANSDRNNGRDYVLTLCGGKGKKLVKWDGVEGSCEQVNADEVGNDLRYTFHLSPGGSLLVTLGGNVQGCAPAVDSVCFDKGTVSVLSSEFDFERSEENVLVMDRISVSFDGGKTFEAEDFEWRIRRNLADRFGTTDSLLWQPWVSIRKGLFDGKGGEIVLRYKFLSDLEKPKASVVIEDLEKGILTVNNTPVETSSAGWHWDRCFGKIDISNLIKPGENIVDFKVSYDFLTEVEPAYIVGDFGVEMVDLSRSKLVQEPKRLNVGSWTDQGYPFYSGRMIYKTSFESIGNKQTLLRLVGPSGTLYKIKVNGQDAGNILWRPFELDITSFVKQGSNKLEVEVVSSLQNSWGPLHEKIGDDNFWCGPEAFTQEYILKEGINSFDYGLLGGAEIVEI